MDIRIFKSVCSTITCRGNVLMLPSHKVSTQKKQWYLNFSGIQGICELVVFLYENGLLQNRADVKSMIFCCLIRDFVTISSLCR